MASPNLDLVRSIFTAWERWEWRSFEWADPEIEVVVADGASPGRWSGLTGMAQGTRDIAVIERLDVLEHGGAQLAPGRPGATVDQLLLQRGEEALGDRVVIRVAP